MPRKRVKYSHSRLVLDRQRPDFPRFGWATIKGTPVQWPVEGLEPDRRNLIVFVKSDNALLKLKSTSVVAFPGKFSMIKQRGLDILQKKRMMSSLHCFCADIDWALEGNHEHSMTGEDHDHSMPGEDHEHSMPGEDQEHSMPGDNHEHSMPGKDDEHSMPGEDHEHIMPGEDQEHSMPGDKHEYSMPGKDDEHSMPGEDHEHSMPGEDQEHSMPGENCEHSMPGKDDEHSMTGENHEHSMPGKDDEHIMAGEDQEHSMPGENCEHSMAGDNHAHSMTGDGHGECSEIPNSPNYINESDDEDLSETQDPDYHPPCTSDADTDSDVLSESDAEHTPHNSIRNIPVKVRDTNIRYVIKESIIQHNMPADDNEHSMAGEDKEHSMPGEDREHSMTGEDNDESMSGEDHEESMSGEDHEHRIPGDGHKLCMLGEDREHSMQGEDHEQSMPREMHEHSTPGEMHEYSTPGEMHELGEEHDQGTSGKEHDQGTSGEEHYQSTPGEGHGECSEIVNSPEYCPPFTSDTDADSDVLSESDAENTPHNSIWSIPVKEVHDTNRRYVKEKYTIRDINNPGIYVRRNRKSTTSSKAQEKRKKPGNNRVYDNFHCCYYCGEMRQHIGTHLQTHVHTIREVQKILKEKKPDFSEIRKRGDHKHNKKVAREGIGEIILSRRPDELDMNQYGPCISCNEWLLLKNLKRHLRTCNKTAAKMTKGQIIIQSHVEAGVISANPSKWLLNEVFPGMLTDDIGKLAQRDHSIVCLGESWLRRTVDNREKRRYYTSQHMRLMARLLVEVRRLDGDSSEKTFADYLIPKHFGKIIAGALECCVPYMDDIEELQAPSNGIKLKYDMRRMLTARWAMLVKGDPHSSTAKDVQTFIELVNIEWDEKITRLARTVLVRRQFNIQKELPDPEDVQTLTTYLMSELKSIKMSADNFFRIVRLTQVRLLTYNKRRSGEIDVIRLDAYARKTTDLDEIDESLVGDLTKVEQYLLKSQDLIKVRGKGHRPVPVLIPADAKLPLDYIASRDARENAGIKAGNMYLFPNSEMQYARSYESLKKVCEDCTLQTPASITSVSMRKYTATLTQMLNLDKNQLEWMCRHLGHTGGVHKAHSRQMSGLIERLHITKLFLVQDMNLTQQFKGKTLDEIDVQDIVFPNTAEGSGGFEGSNDAPLVDAVVGDLPQSESTT